MISIIVTLAAILFLIDMFLLYWKSKSIKTILILLTTIGLLSCEKAEQPEPKPIEITQPEQESLKHSAWSGKMTYQIDGVVSQTISALREFSDSTVRWFSYPVSIDTIQINQGRYDVSMHIQFNGDCNGVAGDTTVYTWAGAGQLIGDTLHETGTIAFLRTYKGRIIQQSTGTYRAKFTWWRELNY